MLLLIGSVRGGPVTDSGELNDDFVTERVQAQKPSEIQRPRLSRVHLPTYEFVWCMLCIVIL